MTVQRPVATPTKIIRLLYLALLTAFLIPLAMYAVTGASARFAQDDYCYAAHLTNHGWPGAAAANAWMISNEFSGYRFALTFFLDLTELASPIAVPALPALLIALWLPAACLTFIHLNRAFDWGLTRLQCITLAAALLSLTLALAPNRVQVLYWRPGSMTYLAPLVTLTWLTAWIASRLGKPVSGWTMAGMAGLALAAGSFSETGAVFAAGVFSLGLLAAWIGLRKGRPLTGSAFRLCWAGLMGSFLAMAGMILSPTAHARQAALFPEPLTVPEIAGIALESARFFVVHTLYRVTLPTLGILGLAFCLGWLAALPRSQEPGIRVKLALRKYLIQILLGGLIAFLLLICVTAPSAYAQSTYPEARALLFARLVMVLYPGLVGWWSGQVMASLVRPSLLWLGLLPVTLYVAALVLVTSSGGHLTEPAYPDLRSYLFTHPYTVLGIATLGILLSVGLAWLFRRKPGWFPAVVLAILLLAGPIFTIRSAALAYPDERLRGLMWDIRDAQIVQAAAEGQRSITVNALDSWSGVTELQANSDNWVNRCAAQYYGVDWITAVEPILNPPISP